MELYDNLYDLINEIKKKTGERQQKYIKKIYH